jgi:hypothetical protein
MVVETVKNNGERQLIRVELMNFDFAYKSGTAGAKIGAKSV